MCCMSISSFFFLLLLCVSVAAVDHNILHLVKHMAPPSIALQIGPRSVLSSWMERRRSDRRRILDQPLRIGSPSSSGAAAATVIIFPHGEGEAGEKGSTFLVCACAVRTTFSWSTLSSSPLLILGTRSAFMAPEVECYLTVFLKATHLATHLLGLWY